MKRAGIRIIVIIAALFAACNAGEETAVAGSIPSEGTSESGNVQSGRLIAVINDYRDKEGFDVFTVGSLGTTIIKNLIAGNLNKFDEDTRTLFQAIEGIKKIAIVDFGNSNTDVRNEFIQKIEKLLTRSQLLMEIKDNEDNLYMYGVVGKRNNKVSDFVLYNPSGGNIICLFGSIPLDSLAKLTDK